MTKNVKGPNLAKHGHENVQAKWRDSIDLLRLVQSDYQQARKQLEGISSTFRDRENTVSKQLRFAFESATQTKRKYSQNEAMCLRAYCLGSFKLYIDYHQVEHWHSLKSKSILKYLIAQRKQPVHREVLMEVFWEGCSPELANSNLKAAIHSLRKTLGYLSNEENNLPYILYLEGNYFINPKITLLIDDEEFERHWLVGHDLEIKGKFDEAMREYKMAEALYQGDYLVDDIYEEWTLVRREALKDIYIGILIRLAKHCAQEEKYESCIRYCQKILAKDPCCEEGYRHLIRCYNQLGQRNRALQWYRVCERTIKTELDIAPEWQTVTLYRQLLNDEHS